MRIVYGMPFWTCPPNPEVVSQKAIMSLAAAAEQAGFAGVSFTEHPAPSEAWRQAGGHDALDPMVGLSFAAAASTKLRLLTYLIVLPYHNPFTLAKSAATLDALSGGRLTLGLGAGYLKSEYFALGVNFDERNALFDESLKVMKMAWSGEPVSYQGLHFSAKAVTSQPRPVQRPHPPLWLGGNSKLTLRRVAEQAQGWLAMPSTAEQSKTRRSPPIAGLADLETALKYLRDHAASVGRKEPISVHHPVNSDHGEMSPQACIAQVRALSGLGVDWGAWSSGATTLPSMIDDIKRFGDEVIARL